VDHDGDGFRECEGDCDDADASLFPGQAEICNEKDDDCDFLIDQVDPDFVADGDGDGALASGCDLGGNDCDDEDPANRPGPEVCDGQDSDCNGLDDAGMPGVAGMEMDNDGDGQSECEGDCDDGDPANFPGNPEICDGQDNDCNGAADLDPLLLAPCLTFEMEDSYGDGWNGASLEPFFAGMSMGPLAVTSGYDETAVLCGAAGESVEVIYSSGAYESENSYSILNSNDAVLFSDGPYPATGSAWNWTFPPAEGTEVDQDLDGVLFCDGDCDDLNSAVYPGNVETSWTCADGVDNGCDDDANTAPVANAGADVLLSATSTCYSSGPYGGTVCPDCNFGWNGGSADGSASSDAETASLVYSWTEDSSDVSVSASSWTPGLATVYCSAINPPNTVGVTTSSAATVVLTVTDCDDASDTDTLTVTCECTTQ
jgi:hypothetical protein